MAVTVVTLNTSLVRGITAKFNGELIDMNGQAAIDCYFQYRITGASSWSDTSANKEELTAVGQFSYEISGLTENEFYDVRAVAEWTDGTLQNAYGDTETFNASWVREGSREDFSRGIINDVGPYPIFHDADTKSICSSGTTSITVDRPSNIQPGDLILLFFVADMSTYSSGPGDGFTLIRSEGGATCMAWYKIATVGESASYTIQTGTSHKCLVAVRVTNVDIHNPIDQNNGRNSGGGAPSSWEIYGITPTRKYSMLFHAVGIRTSSRSITSPAGTGIQEIFNVTSGAGCIERWQDMMATGSRTYTFSGTTRVGGLIFNVNGLDKLSLRYLDIGVGTRQKPYKITNTGSEITWTATTPTDTTLVIEAEVQGTTAITDEAVGTGDGTETVFTLDHWPADTPTVKVDGVGETGFSLGDDRRIITFDTAPADTEPITASYTAVDDPQENEPEIQELDLDSPAGGTFKLGDGTDWTADIAHDASAADIEAALEGLYGAGNVEVERVAKEILETYTAVGTTSWTVPAGINAVDVLIVAGGGSGGAGNHVAGGGGGAGGIKDEKNHTVTPGSDITVVVGDGGAAVADSSQNAGNKGGDSSFDTLTAIGGGAGGGRDGTAGDGGSGGGGGHHGSGAAGSTEDATQGFNGGDAGAWDGSWYRAGGGGGGAGEIGAAGSSSKAGDGGDGLNLSDRFGTEVGDDGWFGGGGGGSEKEVGTAGDGGKGGGGDGDKYDTARSVDAMANTGGGGGASNANASTDSGKGGSGIVIIALPKFIITFDPSVGDSGLVADFTGLT